MPLLIEGLESRMLLSVAPSLAELASEARVVKADLVALGKVGAADIKTIKADLKAADSLKTNATLLKALVAEGTAAFKVTARGVAATHTQLQRDITKVVAFAKSFNKHPTSSTLEAKLAAAIQTLSTDASNRLSVVTTDLTDEQTTNTTNTEALVSANSGNTQLSTDVSTTIGPETDAAHTALVNALTTTLTTDVNAVIAAFS